MASGKDALIVTPAVARRVERAFTDYTRATLQPVLNRPGNPQGAEIRRFGAATAFVLRETPTGWMYNRVAHLSEAEAALVPEIGAFYRENGTPCRVEVIPADFGPGLAAALTDHGMYPSGLDVALAGTPSPKRGEVAPGVEVGSASSDEELDAFLDARQDSWGARRVAPENRERARASLRLPGLSHFLAYVDGQPAGAATLFTSNRTGYLALAATKLAFRRRGCHAALLGARQETAARLGCDLVVGMTGFGFDKSEQYGACWLKNRPYPGHLDGAATSQKKGGRLGAALFTPLALSPESRAACGCATRGT